jgi:RHS repeat-associated protein
VLRTATAYLMLFAATAHAARLPGLAAPSPRTRVGGSTRISVCFIRLEVKQAPKTHRGNVFVYDATAVASPYAWDKDNRLRSVTPPTGTATAYQYDANGLRTQRVDATGTTRYLIDWPGVLEELDGANATTIKYLNNPQRIDDVLAYQRSGTTEYPLTDALGSIYAATDATGVIVHRYDFDVYGGRTDLGGNAAAIDVGFTGRWHDSNGLIEHRHRQRNPKLGGWLQADPMGMVDGPNVYGYVGNQPTALTDPSGLGFDSPTTQMFAALARGDVVTALYYFETATGVSAFTAQAIIGGLTTALAAELGTPGACPGVAKNAFPLLEKLGVYLGGLKPVYYKIISTTGGIIGFQKIATDPKSTVQLATNGRHVAVKLGDRIFDALTGPGGMSEAEYLERIWPKAIKTMESTDFPQGF